MVQSLLFREAEMSEIPDIKAFYTNNPSKHVMVRIDQALQRAIADRCLLVVEALHPAGTSDWAAVSGVYSYDEYDGLLLKEAGGSLVNSNYENLGIHKVLHALRAVTTHVVEPDFDHYFGAIITPNPKSEHNLYKTGFVDWPTPPEKLVADRRQFALPGQTIKFFELPKTRLQGPTGLAKTLLDYYTARVIQRNSTSTPIDIRTIAVTAGMNDVQRLAR